MIGNVMGGMMGLWREGELFNESDIFTFSICALYESSVPLYVIRVSMLTVQANLVRLCVLVNTHLIWSITACSFLFSIHTPASSIV